MSTQPEPSVAAARSNRSRSRSRSRSVGKTESLVDSEVEETATIDVPELLQTPQIAPGTRDHRFVSALNEQETRQLMRRQPLRIWWQMRGRKIVPDTVCFNMVIGALARNGEREAAEATLQQVARGGGGAA